MNLRYSRARFLVFVVVILSAMGSIFARLAWIQIVDHERARQQVTVMSQAVRELPPRRGAILDRHGYPLAVTEERFDVGVSRPKYWRGDEPARKLASILVGEGSREEIRSKSIGGSLSKDEEARERARWRKRVEKKAKAIQSTLRKREKHTYLDRNLVLTPAQTEGLRSLRWLSVDPVLNRNYPMDTVVARLLGRVNRSGEGDVGIERYCNSVLAGRPGRVLNRFDATNGTGPIICQVLEKPQPGLDVILTLDHRVQMILEQELEATRQEAGAQTVVGVVMDPRDASVLAVASAPGIPGRGKRPYLSEEWRDPVVLDAFEPGSSFKLFTIASLFRRALCDTAEVFDGEGRPHQYRSSADLGGFVFHDVHPVGLVSLRTAFIVSSNIIFGKAASLLRAEEFYSDLRHFGLGMPTGCGLGGENPGILRDVKSWSGRSQATIAIGQEVSVTLLQMAAGYSALLTDGTLRAPRFVASLRDARGRDHPENSRILRESIVPPNVPPILRALCRDVVQEDYGSGRQARVEGMEVGGKTGTAQVARTDGRGYEKDVYTANFIGVAPALDPQLLVAIVVKRPEVKRRWGGDTAAACFSRVVSKILSETRLLEPDHPLLLASSPESVGSKVRIPSLVGMSAEKAQRRLEDQGCRLANEAPSPACRVIGQMPRPGTRFSRGGVVRVAWSGRESR